MEGEPGGGKLARRNRPPVLSELNFPLKVSELPIKDLEQAVLALVGIWLFVVQTNHLQKAI